MVHNRVRNARIRQARNDLLVSVFLIVAVVIFGGFLLYVGYRNLPTMPNVYFNT